ncbi:MAG: DNA-3-methyladenine glycosylase 2 family protein [Gemmatimonadetes bacterium]|nr:DNA-3-methyladenine glycosylase 2 family protein [Gemmatimonadota bacterium]
MAGVIDATGRCGLDTYWRRNAFPALVGTIIAQQISVAAARTIHRRFRRLFGGRDPSARALLAKTDEELRGAGLSRQKIRSLRDLAEHVTTRTLRLAALERMSDEAAVEALSQVKGIGRWTAEVFLIFRLGRLDVLPVDDLGLLESARLMYGLDERPDAEGLTSLAEPWRPYRSVGCWYLWQGRRLATGRELR